MALMIDGQAYLGSSRVTGEIGHLIIGGAPIPCYCGNTGCVEQLASTGAILREVRRGLSELPTLSVLARPGAELDIDAVITAAEQGDKLAYRSVLEAGEFLGAALAVVFNLLGPRLIVVGGAMASSEVYLDAARRVMRLRAISLARGVLLARGELGDLAGARGAATFVLDRLFDPGDTNILALR
jgi:glucokinase